MKKLIAWGKNVVVGFLDSHCSMHAAGLTYFSMLAIVPMLCVLLLAAKTFNADDFFRRQINTQIDAMITSIESGQDDKLAAVAAMDDAAREQRHLMAREFGERARNFSNQVFARVDNFDIGTLGWIGFLALLWTIVSSIGMIEVSFNEIWGIRKPRPLWRRIGLYLFVAVVVPALAVLALSLPVLNIVKNVIVATVGSSSLTRWLSDGLICLLDSTFLRMAVAAMISSLAFAFLFWIMPNCRIGARPALYGGVITALVFGVWMKICAVAQVGIAKSSALYGSLAFLPIVLAWMYMSWQIVLLGANVVRAFGDKVWEVD